MKVNWFDRGRDSMTEGRPCRNTDARISGPDRQSWYAGWHHQARINSSKNIPPGDRADAIAGLQEILNTLKKLP